MSDFVPLDRVVYVFRPCLIGNFIIDPGATNDVFYCDSAEDAEHQEERGNALRFSNLAEYLDYSRELASQGLICDLVDEFLTRFLNAPFSVRSPEWEEALKLFKEQEIGDGIWWPDRIYLHANPVEEPPVV